MDCGLVQYKIPLPVVVHAVLPGAAGLRLQHCRAGLLSGVGLWCLLVPSKVLHGRT